jgi:hypothetical protein
VSHEPLFRFEHGDHACVFYRSEDSLAAVLTAYIAEGLEKHEKCFCVQKPHITERVLNELQYAGVDTEEAIRRGALEFRTEEETYFPEGHFRPAPMIQLLAQSIEASLQQGFTGFRSAGDLGWGAGHHRYSQLVKYEHMVNKHYSGRAATGLCQYPTSSFPPEVLSEILGAHRVNVIDPEQPSLYATVQIRKAPYVTEFVRDRFTVDPSYSYVIRRDGSDDVLASGEAPNFKAARAKAAATLRTLALKTGKSQKRASEATRA